MDGGGHGGGGGGAAGAAGDGGGAPRRLMTKTEYLDQLSAMDMGFALDNPLYTDREVKVRFRPARSQDACLACMYVCMYACMRTD